MKILFIIIFYCLSCPVFASDSTIYICKYKFASQKDPSNISSKFEDLMILSINGKSTEYYSYLRQLGIRNIEDDANKSQKNNVDNKVMIDPIKSKGYYIKNESEIISINYKTKLINVTDKFIENSYYFTENLVAPKWQIDIATTTILNQKCQKATTTFKGRNYIAWFCNTIPFNVGPWLFNGLPGLILRIEDDKKQFAFECIELNIPPNKVRLLKKYDKPKKTDRKKLVAMKKLFVQNPIEFMMSEGKTVTSTDNNGNSISVKYSNKPYNPIDLSQ
jgi:GLPGLI family protein